MCLPPPLWGGTHRRTTRLMGVVIGVVVLVDGPGTKRQADTAVAAGLDGVTGVAVEKQPLVGFEGDGVGADDEGPGDGIAHAQHWAPSDGVWAAVGVGANVRLIVVKVGGTDSIEGDGLAQGDGN